MTTWALLRLNPQSLNRYVDHVNDTNPDIPLYFPRFCKLTRPAGLRQPIPVLKPVYPGYLFAKIDPESNSVHALVSTPIRAYFIRFGHKIGLIPDPVIQELQRLESLNLLVREKVYLNPYTPGRKVIVHTPVADIQAIIVHLIGQNRVLVDTRLCRVTVHTHTISFT